MNITFRCELLYLDGLTDFEERVVVRFVLITRMSPKYHRVHIYLRVSCIFIHVITREIQVCSITTPTFSK